MRSEEVSVNKSGVLSHLTQKTTVFKSVTLRQTTRRWQSAILSGTALLPGNKRATPGASGSRNPCVGRIALYWCFLVPRV